MNFFEAGDSEIAVGLANLARGRQPHGQASPALRGSFSGLSFRGKSGCTTR